jgi:hypothetical protein
MRRSLGPSAALVFIALLVVRHLVLRGSVHFSPGAARVIVVLVALLGVAGLRLFASRR